MINADDEVRAFENYTLDRVLIYRHRINMDSGTVSFVHEPFYEHMVAGGAIELTASGSEDIEPTSASLTLRPGARVTACGTVMRWISSGSGLCFAPTSRRSSS